MKDKPCADPFDKMHNTERGMKSLESAVSKQRAVKPPKKYKFIPVSFFRTDKGTWVQYSPFRCIFIHPIKWWKNLKIKDWLLLDFLKPKISNRRWLCLVILFSKKHYTEITEIFNVYVKNETELEKQIEKEKDQKRSDRFKTYWFR